MSSCDIVPPGYRFYPTEEELVGFYLQNKLEKRREEEMETVIPVVDVYYNDPWQLPGMAGDACRKDGQEWIFFCPRQEREIHGGRKTRTTPSGYWKATGSPSPVFSNSQFKMLGIKKTMVFYKGRAPTGSKTHWKMHEYKCFQYHVTQHPQLRGEYSVCRVYTNSGCIRAFDRRPQFDPNTPAKQPAMAAKRTMSHESIFSNDNGEDQSASNRFVRQRIVHDHDQNDELNLFINDNDTWENLFPWL